MPAIDFITKSADASAHIAQVIAILVGGSWAYFKFIRGRVFQSRIDLQVDASLFAFGHDGAVTATIRLHNIGLSRFHLAAGKSRIAVFWCPSAGWPASSEQWPELVSRPLFLDQQALESGESVIEEWLLPLTGDPNWGFPLAYDVRAAVASEASRFLFNPSHKRVWWSANAVLPAALQQSAQATSGAKVVDAHAI